MSCKVFVSCGQRPHEKQLAQGISELLRARGFRPYLAIDAQTICDIDGGIIGELKTSDCYLFVNSRREPIGADERSGELQYRGSLFSNQEFAIAYALEIEKLLIINQEGVRPEGMLRYIGVNTETFRDDSDCLAVLSRALDRAGWTPEYSRQLSPKNLRFSESVLTYKTLQGWFLYLDIHNRRPDVAALETTARLYGYAQRGRDFQASPLRSPLKATARPGFMHTIFPNSHEAFDLLCIGADARPPLREPLQGQYTDAGRCQVFLNDALDVTWSSPLNLSSGWWIFRYEFYAVGFPVLTVDVEVEVPRTMPLQAPRARLINE